MNPSASTPVEPLPAITEEQADDDVERGDEAVDIDPSAGDATPDSTSRKSTPTATNGPPKAETGDSTSDESLVEQYKKGDDAAFASLVTRYEKELYHFILRFTGRPGLAEDVFQDTFLQVHLSIHTFDTDRRFRPWLFTIAANKARDSLRRKSQRLLTQLSAPMAGDNDGPSFLDLVEAEIKLPNDQVECDETQALVRQSVDELPEHLREILLLAYFHQFAYSEIASMLEIPLGTVKSRLHSAVATFAQQWKHRHGEASDQA